MKFPIVDKIIKLFVLFWKVYVISRRNVTSGLAGSTIDYSPNQIFTPDPDTVSFRGSIYRYLMHHVAVINLAICDLYTSKTLLSF